MFEAKKFYMDSLKNGAKRHDYVAKTLNSKFGNIATKVRDVLLKSDHIEPCGYVVRLDGRKVYKYRLTGKPLVAVKVNNATHWDDGTPRSRFNAFDWQNSGQSLFGKREITAIDVGRKMGLNGSKYDRITVYSRAGV